MKVTRFYALAMAWMLAAVGLSSCASPDGKDIFQPQPIEIATDQSVDRVFDLPPDHHPGLLDKSKAQFTAPEVFRAKFETTQGDFVIEVNRDWAPNGVDRFYSLVRIGYFENMAIFRAVEGFMFQFGVHGVPAVAAEWSKATFADDPAGKSNIRGTITFAQAGRPNSRSAQMFINLGNNLSLDRPPAGSPFVPFGQIVSGKDVLKKINTKYGENPRRENVQGRFIAEGNAYIQDRFPGLDYILSVTVVEDRAK